MGLFGGKRKQQTEVVGPAEFVPVEGEQLFVGEASYQPSLITLLVSRGHAQADLASARRPISESFVARLVPEPDNKYDANAVGVHVSGALVAYLSRGNAQVYRRAFSSSEAEVPVVLWVKPEGKGIVSVWPE